MRLFTALAVLLIAAPIGGLAQSDPVSAPALRVGDSWVFDRTHELGMKNFTQQKVDLRIDRLSSESMLVGIKLDGSPNAFEDHMALQDWSQMRIIDGKETVTGHPFSFPMAVGRSWTLEFTDSTPQGLQKSTHVRQTFKVLGWEDVTTPAGTFHALKIEANGTIDADVAASTAVAGAAEASSMEGGSISHVQRLPERTVHVITYEELYYAPQVKYFVKHLSEQYNNLNVRTRRDMETLASFQPAS